MTDVVDSDELLRRIQRARARAAQEERALRAGRATGDAGPGPDRDAEVRRLAYEGVLGVLDEILTPGRRAGRECAPGRSAPRAPGPAPDWSRCLRSPGRHDRRSRPGTGSGGPAGV